MDTTSLAALDLSRLADSQISNLMTPLMHHDVGSCGLDVALGHSAHAVDAVNTGFWPIDVSNSDYGMNPHLDAHSGPQMVDMTHPAHLDMTEGFSHWHQAHEAGQGFSGMDGLQSLNTHLDTHFNSRIDPQLVVNTPDHPAAPRSAADAEKALESADWYQKDADKQKDWASWAIEHDPDNASTYAKRAAEAQANADAKRQEAAEALKS